MYLSDPLIQKVSQIHNCCAMLEPFQKSLTLGFLSEHYFCRHETRQENLSLGAPDGMMGAGVRFATLCPKKTTGPEITVVFLQDFCPTRWVTRHLLKFSLVQWVQHHPKTIHPTCFPSSLALHVLLPHCCDQRLGS